MVDAMKMEKLSKEIIYTVTGYRMSLFAFKMPIEMIDKLLHASHRATIRRNDFVQSRIFQVLENNITS